MVTGDISFATSSVRLVIMDMGRMRVIGAVRITGALGVRYLARPKVCDATPARGVHPRGEMMGGTFGLVLFFYDLLRGTTNMNVPYASTTTCVDRLSGSGTRLRVGTDGRMRLRVGTHGGHVPCTTAAKRMQSIRGVHTVDGRNDVAIISATTLLRSNRGSLGSSVTTSGIPRGRADVSCATTSGRSNHIGIARRDGVPTASVRVIFGPAFEFMASGRGTIVASTAAACEMRIAVAAPGERSFEE